MIRILSPCNSFFAPSPQSYIICNTGDVTDDWLEIAIVSWGHIYMNTQYKGPKLKSETKALPKLIPESGNSIYIKFFIFPRKGWKRSQAPLTHAQFHVAFNRIHSHCKSSEDFLKSRIYYTFSRHPGLCFPCAGRNALVRLVTEALTLWVWA